MMLQNRSLNTLSTNTDSDGYEPVNTSLGSSSFSDELVPPYNAPSAPAKRNIRPVAAPRNSTRGNYLYLIYL